MLVGLQLVGLTETTCCVLFVCVCAGKLIHYMTGHMDSVTGLAIDEHGQYLLSGGELNNSPSCLEQSRIVQQL